MNVDHLGREVSGVLIAAFWTLTNFNRGDLEMNSRPRRNKTAALSYEVLEPKQLLAAYPALDLAKFQVTTADSSNGSTWPEEATDGKVSNDSRWYSDNSNDPHWLQVEFPVTYPVESAQLFLGKDDSFTVSSFEIQFLNDNEQWETIVSVDGNSATDLNLVFPAVVEADTFRFYTTANIARVKEFSLLPPNDGNPHPLGTDLDFNLVDERGPSASSVYQSNFAYKAVDGWVDDNSRWLVPNDSGPHSIELEIPTQHEIGSLHLYSGFQNGESVSGVLPAFEIEYANGSGWTPIPGGTVSSGTISGNSVSENSSNELIVNFSSPVLADKVRLTFASNWGRVREIVVLPANVTQDGSIGYPIGTSVSNEPRPSTNFKDFHDSWYRIAARSNNNSLIATATGASQADSNTTDAERFFQLLYVKSLDAYRIRNQGSGKGLEVAGASREVGADIVEGVYSAAPHQLWKLVATSDSYYRIVNLWSGLAIETDGGTPAVVTQESVDNSANPVNNQEWKPIFQDDYFKKGTGGWVGQYGTGWGYDWARNDKDGLSRDKFYVPMQHREGWPNLETLHKRYSDWNNDIKPAYLLGFNEPDRPDQANMGVGRAVELWPQLMAMDVPLISPAPAQGGEDWWLNNFSDQIDNLGYRMEYAGGHWYSGPSVDNLFNHINDVQSKANGRPVWLTEFAVVDWSGGSGNWSEETNYNFILEFLWRAESKGNLEKYALFLFSGGSPASPWTMSNPRSNFFSGGSLTPFGKAYAAWDGDKSIENDMPFLIHNRNARHRLRNDGATTEPTPSWIRREDSSVQWLFRDAGNGKRYIQSGNDGRLLRWNGTTLDYAPAGTLGAEVEWTTPREQYGWHNIVSEVDGKFLRLHRVNDVNNAPVSQTFEMVTAEEAASYSSTDWWFVKPYKPVTDVSAVVDADGSPNEVHENAAIGTLVGITGFATDDDDGQEVSYSLVDDADGKFQIDQLSGVVSVAGEIDFESASNLSVVVMATSTDGSSSAETFGVSVLNQNDASVSARMLIYEGSSWDTNSDLDAIANKIPLYPGEVATFENYSSYSKGINAIIMEVNDLNTFPTLANVSDFFEFRVGNTDTPENWDVAPLPAGVTFDSNAVGKTDRIKLLWDDNDIEKQWLQVKLLANETTGLPVQDTFYFGNSIGETGNDPANAIVNLIDVASTRSNQTGFGSADLGNRYDFDRNGKVNLIDVAIARQNQSGFTPLRLLDLGGGSGKRPTAVNSSDFPLQLRDSVFGDLDFEFLSWRNGLLKTESTAMDSSKQRWARIDNPIAGKPDQMLSGSIEVASRPTREPIETAINMSHHPRRQDQMGVDRVSDKAKAGILDNVLRPDLKDFCA